MIFTKRLKPSADLRSNLLEMFWQNSLALVLESTSKAYRFQTKLFGKWLDTHKVVVIWCFSTSSVSSGKYTLWKIWVVLCWMASTSTRWGGYFRDPLLSPTVQPCSYYDVEWTYIEDWFHYHIWGKTLFWGQQICPVDSSDSWLYFTKYSSTKNEEEKTLGSHTVP